MDAPQLSNCVRCWARMVNEREGCRTFAEYPVSAHPPPRRSSTFIQRARSRAAAVPHLNSISMPEACTATTKGEMSEYFVIHRLYGSESSVAGGIFMLRRQGGPSGETGQCPLAADSVQIERTGSVLPVRMAKYGDDENRGGPVTARRDAHRKILGEGNPCCRIGAAVPGPGGQHHGWSKR